MRPLKPQWLKKNILSPNSDFVRLETQIQEKGLHTVCWEAQCPNQCECWAAGTATFMVLGKTCTRTCRFCSISHANKGDAIDSNEPSKLAEAVAYLKLKYVVLTMVDRDDLIDGGARHVAKCITSIKSTNPSVKVEVLTGDFRGNEDALHKILSSKPDVFGHNLEVVKRLQSSTRDKCASYPSSLTILRKAKEIAPKIFTKSSLMVGLGETKEEVLGVMKDLRSVGVDFLTLGQYLQPSKSQLDVVEYVSPEHFLFYKQSAVDFGFKGVASGPFVRSSYKAYELFAKAKLKD